MSDRDEILAKIQKCLALAQGGSEHEAAAALRQARKLMDLHQVSDTEMLAAGVAESSSKSGAIRSPAQWENSLAAYIARMFGCKLIFCQGWSESMWSFIGCPPSHQVAAYSFDVLYRQAKKARAEFISTSLKRYKKSNKVRRADLFSDGWVQSACAKVAPMTPSEAAAEAIRAYMQLKHPELGELKATDRNADRSLNEKDMDALYAGHHAGRGAELHRGVGANAAPLMLEN